METESGVVIGGCEKKERDKHTPTNNQRNLQSELAVSLPLKNHQNRYN